MIRSPSHHNKTLAVNVSAKVAYHIQIIRLLATCLRAVKEDCGSGDGRKHPAVSVVTKTDYFSEEGGNKTVFLKLGFVPKTEAESRKSFVTREK